VGDVVNIDIMDYMGVKGDGSDQTAALQAALDNISAKLAATNGRGHHLFFPKGVYRSGLLTLTNANYLTISGYGATILSTNASGSTTPSLQLTGSYIQIYGLSIEHVTPADPPNDIKANFAHGLDILGGTPSAYGRYCHLRDVKIYGAWYHGISIRFFRGASVDNCDVERVLATGITVTSCDDMTVSNNTVRNTRDDLIFIGATTVQDPNNASARVCIVNNHVSDGQEKGIGFSGVLGGVCMGNTVQNTYTGAIRLYLNTADNLGPTTVFTVSNNTVIDGGQNYGGSKHPTPNTVAYGIQIANGSSSVNCTGNVIVHPYGHGINAVGDVNVAGDKRRVIISDNQIYNSTVGSGITVGSAAAPDQVNVARFNITDNLIDTTYADGISVQSCSLGNISDNTILSWGQSPTGTRSGILVDNCVAMKVTENLLYNDSTSGATKQTIAITNTTPYHERQNTVFGPGGDLNPPAVVLPSATVVRTTDATGITNSTTLVNDDTLTVPLLANSTYKVKAYLRYTAATTGDLQFGFTCPTGASGRYTPNGLSSAATSNTFAITRSDLNISTAAATVGGAGTATMAIAEGVVITGGTAGNITVKWAQGTSDATATQLLAQSYLAVEKVA
jgi:hypothetical protein